LSKGKGESGTNKLEEQQIKENLQSLLVRPSGRARGAGGFRKKSANGLLVSPASSPPTIQNYALPSLMSPPKGEKKKLV